MCKLRLAAALLACFGAGLAPTAAVAQNYPTKAIRIVTSEPGGGLDFQARIFATPLTAALGHPVTVENRGGAGGAISMDTVAKAAPDGYTLLFYATSLWVLPLIRKVPFDPIKDFIPISMMDKSPNLFVIHPSVPANSVKEFIALAKASPGKLTYASGGTGSSTHLTVALFTSMADVNVVHIPYKGGGSATTSLIANQTQMMIATAGSVAPHIKAGRMKAIAISSAEPSALFPGMPTIAAAVPGYEAVTLYGFFAPAKTDPAIIKRLNQEMVRVAFLPEVKEKLTASGAEPVGSTPEAFAAAIKIDQARIAKVVKEQNIRED